MRFLQLLLPFLAWISLGLAQTSGLAAAVAQLSPCAQRCLGAAIEDSPCTATNATCICTNAPLQSNVEACLLSSCTLRESLTTKNVTATTCHAPIRDKSESSRVANIVLSVVSSSCGLTRIIYKAAYSMGELGWDDYTIILTLLAGVPSVVIIDKGALPNGLGRDVWTVPFERITNFVRWLYILEILYFFQLTLLKLTLLFFFLRIFPKKIVRNLLKGTIAFTILYGIAFIIAAVFQCRPISHYWNSWDLEHKGQCININGLAWTNAGISIVLDVWMLVLPLWEVFKLQLSFRKKISVALMFLVGTFVTVVSCLRLQSLVHFAVSSNPTWDQTPVINWSNIEINVGIICACMPTLRVILVRIFPSIMGTTKGASSQTYHAKYGYGSRSRSHGGSKMGQMSASGSRGVNEITYTKTFEVQHADNDEVELMQVDDFGKRSPKPRSSNTSEVSL